MNPPRTNDFIKIVSNKVMSKFCPRRGDFHPNSGDVSNRGPKMKSCMELPLMNGRYGARERHSGGEASAVVSGYDTREKS